MSNHMYYFNLSLKETRIEPVKKNYWTKEKIEPEYQQSFYDVHLES